MRRTSRWRFSGIAIAATAAVLVGMIATALSPPAPAAAATDGQMIYPASGTIQSRVGDGCRSNYRAHDGIDISGQGGTPILAAYDGVVKTRTYSSGYGYYVDIEHTGGYATRYAHMVAQGVVAPGTHVVRGQQIGVVGSTGNSTGAHLHFEVWRNGSVYSAINDGFVCLSTVSRGNTLPLIFPGLRTAPTAPLSPVSSADYNGDGKADLLGISADSDLQFLAGNGGGALQSPSIITSGWGVYRHLVHTDLNADGRGDILAVRGDGLLEYYGGGSSGGFGRYDRLEFGWSDMVHVVSGADFSGDGLQDVLATSSAGELTIYNGNGAGALSGARTKAGSGWGVMKFLAGGDFNGDGIGDIMAVAHDGTLYFYRGVGNAFTTATAVGSGWAPFTAFTGGVDYNGDGRVDIIGRDASGTLYLYPGDGTGRFGARSLIGSGWGGYLQLE
ncbi:FG-GAP-like repeat-containing protein [Microbacterium sp. A196]|uniref:FG-GAP-like repeat-containing protein n=1 Tax=Microbacterium sp. A196 TaxID=3457320 RepID=UPI003FD41782